MLAEIFARGPIAVTVACPPAFENYTGGIFEDKTGDVSLDHSVEVVGWGVENGVRYWIGRNSWVRLFGLASYTLASGNPFNQEACN